MLEAYRLSVKVKSIYRRARESAQWLRALDTLAENPGLIADAQQQLTTICYSSTRRSTSSFQTSTGTRHTYDRHRCRQNTHVHEITINQNAARIGSRYTTFTISFNLSKTVEDEMGVHTKQLRQVDLCVLKTNMIYTVDARTWRPCPPQSSFQQYLLKFPLKMYSNQGKETEFTLDTEY